MSVHRFAALALFALATPALVLANFPGTDVFIPSLGHGPGAGGAQWYACIWVHNPNAAAVNVTFRLLLRNQANPAAQVYNETIPAGDTRRYDDALATLFGVTAQTFGAVRVTTPAGQPVIVNARSYNKPPGFDDMDTTGQFYAALPASFAIGPQQKTQLLGVYQTTPQATSEYRYNYGFVETTGNSVTVQVTALDESGAPIGSKSYTLGGYQASQYNITDLLPQVSTTNVRLEVAVTSGPGQVVVFGAGVANRSNDPSTFEMSFRDELLAANSPGGGLTSVAHDSTLTGNGTTATPLGIADSGVSAGKIASGQVVKSLNGLHDTVTLGAGSNITIMPSGQTLTIAATGGGGASGVPSVNGITGAVTIAGSGGTTVNTAGSTITVSSSGGLTLPYSGTINSTTTAFSVTNTGLGGSMGVYGSGGNVGVQGASGNYGVLATGGNYGVLTSGGNVGVYASGDSKYGVWGTTTSTAASSAGVYGSGSGKYGVWGTTTSGNAGVYGGVSSGVGVVGDGQIGVRGNGTNIGVFGVSDTGKGVFGSSTTGYSGYFSGTGYFGGLLTKAGGGFKIDHPLDPANKYLYHSFVESPDMKNVYDGVVTTDTQGRAVVKLPDWFEAVNRDFRYQLTVIGRFAQAIIEQKIANNSFVIRTNLANVEVSWQVTGIRQDPWANAHRLPVEEDKPGAEDGSYLHPELYGQPEEKSVEWTMQPEVMRRMKEEREKAATARP